MWPALIAGAASSGGGQGGGQGGGMIKDIMGIKDQQAAKMMGLGSLVGGLFGARNAQDPGKIAGQYYQQANQYLGQTPGYVDQYLSPYMQAGQGAMGTLQGQYQGLLGQNPSGQYQNLVNQSNPMENYLGLTRNPGEIMNQMGSGYQQSPGYQYNVDQATKASNNAAAAGGFIGSPQQQEQLAHQVSGMASQDYNQYLNNAMGLYGQGLQGMGNLYGAGMQGMQGQQQLGYGAAQGANQTLSDMLRAQAQNAQSQAEMQYYNTQDRNKAKAEQGSAMGGLFGGLLGGLFF
jgi:hypothetical protein